MPKLSQLISMVSPVGALRQGVNLYNQVKDKSLKGVLSEYYDMSPQKYALEQQEAAAIRAEEREMAYKDPSAEMARLKKAGINPHQYYAGGAGGSTVQFRSPGQMQAPTGVVERALQLIQLGAGLANTSSSMALRATQMGVNTTRMGQIATATELASQKLDHLKSLNPIILERAKQVLDTQEITNALTQSRTDLINQQVISEMQRQGLMTNDMKIQSEVWKSKKLQNQLAEAVNPSLIELRKSQADSAEVDARYAEALATASLTSIMMQQRLMSQEGVLNRKAIEAATLNNSINRMQEMFLTNGDFGPRQFWEVFMKILGGGLQYREGNTYNFKR